LDFIDLIFEGDQSQNLLLFDGDVIILPKAENEYPEQESEILSANLAPNEIKISVVGEVVAPGTFRIKSGTPLVQGIFKAGGPSIWTADYANVDLLRMNRNGSVFSKTFRINLNENASSKKNPILKDGDVIRVRRTNLAKASDALFGLTKPMRSVVTIWQMFKIFD